MNNNGAEFYHAMCAKDYLILARYNYNADETQEGHKYLTKGLATIANRFES